MTNVVLVWFRNDLRLLDNPLLHLPQVSKAATIIGVYCFDKRFENKFSRVFRQQAIAHLSREMNQRLDIPLLVFEGQPENILTTIAKRFITGGSVVCSEEVTSNELAVDRSLRKSLKVLGWSFETTWNYSLFHPADLSFDIRETASPFTSFRKDVESASTPVRMSLRVPELSNKERVPIEGLDGLIQEAVVASWLNEFSASKNLYRGGEDAALLRLEAFCSAGLATYKDTRNESLGWDYSTKLSPWLAAGCISPRTIYHRVAEYEKVHGESVHTYWVTFELMTRDYMRFMAVKHGDAIFHETGPAGILPNGVSWSSKNLPRMQAWKTGFTGIPWVDGHMREMNATGYMSNRGRQNVASFLVHNLQVDWRLGSEYFEEMLVDYDVTSNWCNWAQIVGVGSRNQRVNRFNMDKQAREHDPRGLHAKTWIPELANVDNVHDMALRPPGVVTDGYPCPVVLLRSAKPLSTGQKHKSRAHRGKTKEFVTQ